MASCGSRQRSARRDLVGFDRLNPQLQERVIKTHIKKAKPPKDAQTFAQGKPAAPGARNVSARPVEK